MNSVDDPPPGAAAAVPDGQCIWPGCTRPRAAGRAAGSGRQKEYCLQADPPERGGGPVHNARNRWASLRNGTAPRAGRAGSGAGDDAAGGDEPGPAGLAEGQQRSGGRQAEHASVRDLSPFSSAKQRASELLEQARRQHAAAAAGLRAELELYQHAGEELASLADPAALDLEIATIAARAGRQVAQAEQDAADSRRAQLAAQRERDEAVRLRAAADDAAEQLTEDTAEAERALALRTAGFERDLADLASRAQAAEAGQRRARDEATAVKSAAEAAVSAAQERARRETAEARSHADDIVAAARQEARKTVADAREQAAREQALLAERASAARAEADRARADAAQARESAERAREEAGTARADRERAQAAAAAATAATAAAQARATAATAELERAREEFSRLRDAHAGELARLAAAHEALLNAERARAARAEADLAALRP